MKDVKRHVVKVEGVPKDFPTHRHTSDFWEALGRTVATFGFLEETLGKAIFAFTATREVSPEEFEDAFAKWLPTITAAVSDPLGGLIDRYGSAVRKHSGTTITNLDALLSDLRSAAAQRNVVCHGSWRPPDAVGRSLPLFVTRRLEIFDTAIDVAYLNQLRAHAVDLIFAVINSVTHMGWQFPGSTGPGRPVLETNCRGAGRRA